MTKPLNTQLSQQDGPAPRSTSRPRTWLVALLGFGAADLLVLNLWAIPNLITGSSTTTDMRAAQSGEQQAAQQPTAAAALPAEPAAAQVEAAPRAEPAAPEGAAAQEGAKAEPVAREDERAEPAARDGAKIEPAARAEAVADQADVDSPARPVSRAEARANAAKRREALRQPPPEPEHPAVQPAGGEPADARQLAAADSPGPAQTTQAQDPQLAAAANRPEAAQPTRDGAPPQLGAAAQMAPAAAPAGLSPEAYAPPDPGSAAPLAIRAAQRAVRFALQDRAAAGGTGPFDGLGDEDKPFTQIYFSLGNFMLGPNGKQVLERVLPQLTSDQRPILIVGSADPSGSEQLNEKLSDARAQAVAEWLLVHGVDAARIQTRAIGHEGAVGNTLDRRVDLWLGGSR